MLGLKLIHGSKRSPMWSIWSLHGMAIYGENALKPDFSRAFPLKYSILIRVSLIQILSYLCTAIIFDGICIVYNFGNTLRPNKVEIGEKEEWMKIIVFYFEIWNIENLKILRDPIDNKPRLVRVMFWRRTSDVMCYYLKPCLTKIITQYGVTRLHCAGLRPDNGRDRYQVTPFLIGYAET